MGTFHQSKKHLIIINLIYMKEANFKLLVLPAVRNIQQVIDKFPFPIELTKGQFKNLEILFCNGEIKILHDGVDLRSFSFIWLSSSWRLRDLAYAIQLYLNQNKVPHTHVEKSTSKLTDHMAFALNNIPSPNTLFIGHKNIKKSLTQIKNVCGYPLVIKDVKGSQGTHSVKVAAEEELFQKMKELPKHKNYLFQQHISNDYDWGIMVAAGVVVSGEKSYHCADDFRNNACNGAEEVFVDPADIPEHIKKLAITTSNALGLLWSRADILIDKNTQEPYVLEINRFPGITSETNEVEGAYTFLSAQITSLVRQV